MTAEDMQKKKNDVKARTTLLLSPLDEHQLRFTKGSETLEQTFNRLQVIVSQLQFMDVEIEQDDLNQKFLTNLAPEWLMQTIVWRNKSDLNTMSIDNLYNHLKMSHFARECRAPRSQDRGRRDNYRQGSKVEEQAPKALMAINEVGWDWSYMANDEENHALIADEETPTEFALMAKTSAKSEVFDNSLCSKACKKNSDSLNKCADDTVTDYSRPAPTIESFLDDAQNKNPSVTETEASPSTISHKPFINFVKANDSPTKSKIDKAKTAKKPRVVPKTTLMTKTIGTVAALGTWHATSYLSNYEPFDGGYVSFGQGGCKITDNLGKFEAKGDEGYFIGYSMSIKTFRVFNKRTKRVEENSHVEFLENKSIEKGVSPNWLSDIDSLTKSMNYVPVDAGTNSTNLSGIKDAANQEVKKDVSSLR
nr:putative ribonuclease H-like domain-containing protein [Tanacetum cinerariifolium]